MSIKFYHNILYYEPMDSIFPYSSQVMRELLFVKKILTVYYRLA